MDVPEDRGPEEERARRLRTEPAQRILLATRQLIAERGVDRSHVVDIARKAGVARGLVNYYFGTKDRLLAEAMEADTRARAEHLDELLAQAATLDELLRGIGALFEELLTQEPGAHLASQELAILALRSPEIGDRRARARSEYRRRLALLLADKERSGIIALRAHAEDVAAVLIALGEGITADAMALPEWDHRGALRCVETLARFLLEP